MLVLNLLMVVIVATRMTGSLMMEVTMEMLRIRTIMIVVGVIKEIEVEIEITITIETTKISTMVVIMTIMMGSRIKVLGINTEGIKMVDSIMQMEGTTMKVTNSLIFTFRNLIDNPCISFSVGRI
ncbi:unnamed protein product [Lactuca saligna]|uniref:Secreted protein n=1 Tax=Lactuca saligna TaxID=75948 RepID=A0AA35Y009_LACSI|nr:unnamed protein product [Lactuca saligna]